MFYYYRRNLLLYSSADAPVEASKLVKASICDSMPRTKERDSGLAMMLIKGYKRIH